jgi:hypothetical protein
MKKFAIIAVCAVAFGGCGGTFDNPTVCYNLANYGKEVMKKLEKETKEAKGNGAVWPDFIVDYANLRQEVEQGAPCYSVNVRP